jgi:predicted ArsR family transcriptional regulator
MPPLKRVARQVGAPAQGGTRRTDPDTSLLAAVDNASKSGTQRLAILRVLAEHGELTAEEIDEKLGWHHRAAGRRMKELRTKYGVALVETTGEKRPTSTGSMADVYRITFVGRRVLQNPALMP